MRNSKDRVSREVDRNEQSLDRLDLSWWVGLPQGHHRTLRVPHELGRHTAQEEAGRAAPTVGPHDDEVDVVIRRIV